MVNGALSVTDGIPVIAPSIARSNLMPTPDYDAVNYTSRSLHRCDELLFDLARVIKVVARQMAANSGRTVVEKDDMDAAYKKVLRDFYQ